MTRIVLVGAGQRRVHPQPARRHPLVPGAARRGARPPRHRRRPARDRPADGRAGPPAPSARRRRSRRTSTAATALAGADFVIDTIQVGGARATQIDFDIPGRYGLQYTINDTINVGGVLRGLRTIPVVLGHRRRHGRRLPRRAVPQLHEPDGDARPGGRRGGRVPDGRPVPLGLLDRAPPRRVPRRAVRGGRRPVRRRQPPRLDPAPRAPRPRPLPGPRRRSSTPGRVPDDDLVRADLFRRFGFYPDRVLRAPRRVQPVVHPQGPGRAVPRPDRRVPRRGSRTTSTSTPRRSGGSTPASRSRSSAAASTRP